jgi:hypothetical protein
MTVPTNGGRFAVLRLVQRYSGADSDVGLRSYAVLFIKSAVPTTEISLATTGGGMNAV